MKLLPSPFKKDSSPQPSQEPRTPRWGVLVALGVLATGAGLSLTYFLSRPQTEKLPFVPIETFPLNGQVKGDKTDVVAIVPGQVEWVAVNQGDTVDQGQVVVQLNSEELQTQLEEIQAQLAIAEQYEQQVEAEREVLREKLWDAYLKLRPDESELDEWVKNADQNISAAETQLAEARADLQRARADLGYTSEKSDRSTQSPKKGTPRQQQQIQQLETRVHGLENELRLARGAWVRAVSTGLSPYIHSPELDTLRQQWVQVLGKLSDAKESVFQLTAKQQALESRFDRLTIASPVDGIVTHRQAELGDTIRVGEPLLSIANVDDLYLEAYIPNEAQDEAQTSERARVLLDADPGQPLDARVISIDRPSTIPGKTDNRPDDSSTVVIQLSIENPNSTTIPGRSVEGEIVFLN